MIGRRPDAVDALERLTAVLAEIPDRVVACREGVDSLVLATVASSSVGSTRVAHTAAPAVWVGLGAEGRDSEAVVNAVHFVVGATAR